jgi:hypothetical protein
MHRRAKLLSFVLLTAAAAVASFTLTRNVRLRGQEPTRKPFTAVMVERQYHGDAAEPTRTEVYLRAFRSDGSQATVKQGLSPHKESKETKVILDLSGRQRVTVDQLTESRTTYPLSDSDLSHYRAWPKNECTGKAGLERSTLLGYEVRKVEKDMPDGGTHLDLWMAPILDCFELQEDWAVGAPGETRVRVTRQAVYIIEGEPAATLFDIPPAYVERAPSEVRAEFMRRYPEGQLFSHDTAQAMDDVYLAHRQPGR